MMDADDQLKTEMRASDPSRRSRPRKGPGHRPLHSQQLSFAEAIKIPKTGRYPEVEVEARRFALGIVFKVFDEKRLVSRASRRRTHVVRHAVHVKTTTSRQVPPRIDPLYNTDSFANCESIADPVGAMPADRDPCEGVTARTKVLEKRRSSLSPPSLSKWTL